MGRRAGPRGSVAGAKAEVADPLAREVSAIMAAPRSVVVDQRRPMPPFRNVSSG